MANSIEALLEGCIKGDRLAQRRFYEHFKGKMFMVCLRYADCREDAEDMLQEGFVKIFRDLHQYQGQGSLEGWMRKVVVNVALYYLKKKKRLQLGDVEDSDWKQIHETEAQMHFQERLDMVLKMMQQLPTGFRTVLNLYILEGYNHREISALLGISEGTSKSQLNRAKSALKEMIANTLS
jgi:RNA polymerase sigma-70 factor (ECF subfamily)